MKTLVLPTEGLIPEYEEAANCETKVNGKERDMKNKLEAVSSDYIKHISELQKMQSKFKSWASQKFDKRKVLRADYDSFMEMASKLSETIIRLEARTVSFNQVSSSLGNSDKVNESIQALSKSNEAISVRNERSFAEIVQIPRKGNPVVQTRNQRRSFDN